MHVEIEGYEWAWFVILYREDGSRKVRGPFFYRKWAEDVKRDLEIENGL